MAYSSSAVEPVLLDPGDDHRPEAQEEDHRDYGDDCQPAGAAEELVEEEALA